MNCAAARNRLLSLPDPAEVPAPVAGHLAECPACLAWHGLLARIDVAVAAFPIPASDGSARRRLLDQFRPRPASASRPLPVPSKAVVVPAASPIGERLARLWPFGLVAAALLVGALSWAILSGDGEQAGPLALGPDPMLERVVAAKIRIDTADSPADRLAGWSDLAGEIHAQAGLLHKVTPDQMESLARMYEKVVGDDALVATARNLSADEQRDTLPRFTEKLVAAEQEANRLAAEAPPHSVRPLQRIAEAAQGTRTKLTLLQQGRGT